MQEGYQEHSLALYTCCSQSPIFHILPYLFYHSLLSPPYTPVIFCVNYSRRGSSHHAPLPLNSSVRLSSKQSYTYNVTTVQLLKSGNLTWTVGFFFFLTKSVCILILSIVPILSVLSSIFLPRFRIRAKVTYCIGSCYPISFLSSGRSLHLSLCFMTLTELINVGLLF